MTRIAIDIPTSLRTLEQLRGARDGMQHGALELIRPHFGLFPPDVLAFMVPAQAQLAGGLRAGSQAVQLERRQLAARIAAFQLADGGAIDPAVQAALEEPFETPGLIPGLLPPGVLDSLLTGGDILSEFGTGIDAVALAYFGMLRFAERSLPASARTPFAAFYDDFQTRYVGRLGGRALGAVGIGMALKSNYEASSASTRFGRATSAVLGTGVATRHPALGLVDYATGGGLAASMDANVVLVESGIRAISGDPSGAARTLEQWSEDALAGKHGWVFKGVSEFGYGLGERIYEGSEALSAAGEKLGGTLHDVAGKGKELLNRLPRPSWL